MARFLHLLKADASAIARPVIEQNAREPDADVTVVLLPGASRLPLPAGIAVRELGADGLDYSSLLDLIFASDHVVAW